MKCYRQLMLLFLLIIAYTAAYPQRFSIGAGSGFNFSDLHSTTTYGHWKNKPGPVAGLFADWKVNRTLGLHTGVDYSVVYYEYHGYNLYYYPGWYFPAGYYPEIPIIGTPYPPVVQGSNYSFVTIPLQMTVTIPSKPSMTLGAGAYYAFAVDMDTDMRWIYDQADSLKNDLGYIYQMRLTYPLLNSLDLFVRARYLTGRRYIDELPDSKHGYADLMAGLIFRIGHKDDDDSERGNAGKVNEDIYLDWLAGVNISRNSGTISGEKYSVYVGPSAGFMLNFRLSNSGTWFRTGLILDRQGYSMRDSSDYFYMYYGQGDHNYAVKSRVSIDYAVIPVLLDFHFGRDEIFSMSTGPYFAARLSARCAGTAMHKTTSGYYMLEETTIYDDLTNLIKRNDFGWMAGAAIAIPLRGNLKIDMGITYRQGFPDVFKASTSGIHEPDNSTQKYIRNSTLTLQAGLRIPLYR